MTRVALLLSALGLLVVGCGGESAEGPAEPPGEGAGLDPEQEQSPADQDDPSTGAGGESGDTPDQASALDACGVPGDVIAVDTADELTERMTRRWLYCSGFEIFGQHHDGVELNEDGTWAFLRYDTAGVLQPQKGFDGGGTWTMLDTQAVNGPGSFQVNLDTSAGSNPSFMSFQDHPSAMRLSTTGGLTDYVAAE